MTRRAAIIPPADRLGLSRTEAAEYIGVSTNLFDMMVADRRMPTPKRINARTVWDRRQIERAFSALPDGADQPQNDPYAETAA